MLCGYAVFFNVRATRPNNRNILYLATPNVVVKWLTLLLCIRENPVTNFSPVLVILTECLREFLQSLQLSAEIAP
jgi:hypothetical protein